MLRGTNLKTACNLCKAYPSRKRHMPQLQPRDQQSLYKHQLSTRTRVTGHLPPKPLSLPELVLPDPVSILLRLSTSPSLLLPQWSCNQAPARSLNHCCSLLPGGFSLSWICRQSSEEEERCRRSLRTSTWRGRDEADSGGTSVWTKHQSEKNPGHTRNLPTRQSMEESLLELPKPANPKRWG